MGSVININKSSYTEDALIDNWSDEFVKQNIRLHRECEELDHCDGSVTERKLSDEVRERINAAVQNFQMAQQRISSVDVKAGVAVEKAEKLQNDLYLHNNNFDIHTTAEEKNGIVARINTISERAERAFEDSQGALNEALYAKAYADLTNAYLEYKTDKPDLIYNSEDTLIFEFSACYNSELRNRELTTLSFAFGNGVYAEDYIAGLSFDSGETPTAIDYTDSGILNWVGTDCVKNGNLSIFQPSANMHYDIVFYFNGTQFIGLVNGYVPAGGNEAI